MTKIDGGLSDEFRKHLPGFHFQRIETGGTGRGIPDTNACILRAAPCPTCGSRGVEFWIEFKWTDGWVLGLSPEQYGWHDKRARHGGRTWVAVRRRAVAGPRRGEAVDELWVIPGSQVIAVQEAGGLRACAEGQHGARLWRGGPSKWDWDAVRALLTR